eukprot:13958928-Alexandrium_andersonii.AAC.1
MTIRRHVRSVLCAVRLSTALNDMWERAICAQLVLFALQVCRAGTWSQLSMKQRSVGNRIADDARLQSLAMVGGPA